MSNTSGKEFTLRVRIGNNEIEISGNHEEVMKTLSNVSDLISKVTVAFGSAPLSTGSMSDTVPQAHEEEYPSVSIDPATSCPDAIVGLLSTSWGRKKPRTLGELLAAMKVNAIHYPEGTIKGRLTDLTKKGVLRRINSGRGYEYILIKS
ncbi:hypothetical protein MUP00_06245 [Candidatus Bathyarchaeota archaeon]|jgi:hypothetical protein|nr:hypothetical protein [Candidatus Bathyarchaeota archaeon]